MNKWKVLDSTVLLERWWMRLRVDHVRLPNGEEMPEFHVVEYPDWALVIAQDEADRFILVEQYRHAAGRDSLEFPAGMIDEGEDPQRAAARELREETGWEADELVRIGAWSADPGRDTQTAHVFAARNAREVAEPAPDATEQLRIVRMGAADIEQAIESGRIIHGIHIAAFREALRKG